MCNTLCMALDIKKTIKDARAEMRQLIKQREYIDMRLIDLNLALRSLSRMLPHEEREDVLSELKKVRRKPAGLTETISEIMQKSMHYNFTADEIREGLESSGFDLSDYSQPLSTIMTTLRRMADSKKVKAIRKEGRVTYKWIEGFTPLDSVEEIRNLPPLEQPKPLEVKISSPGKRGFNLPRVGDKK